MTAAGISATLCLLFGIIGWGVLHGHPEPVTGWAPVDAAIDYYRTYPHRLFVCCLALYWTTCLMGF